MDYQTFTPPKILDGLVKYFWALDSSFTDTSQKTFTAIPDGCPGVMMVSPEDKAFAMNGGQKLPSIFLYGQTITPALFSKVGRVQALGICFQPHALKSVFGLDAWELRDSCVDLTLVGKKNNLPELLFDAATTAEQVKVFSAYLFNQHQHSSYPDGPIKYAISQLTESKGTLSLHVLQKNMQLSERSLERKFKESVGISPKLFSRIIRFQEAMNQLRAHDYDKLSDIAYAHDYADQSHFIRVFKEFTGFSPIEFRNQSREIAENFPQITR